MEDESYDEELSLFSALKNNLKKTDNDCEFLFNRSSMEKSSKSKSDLKQEHNMKSKEFSPHKNLDEKNNKYHNHNNNNEFEENIEYLSITSTPEGKKRLRNKAQYVAHNEVKRKNKKRKSNVVNNDNDNDNDNESNFNDSQFSVNILNEQKNNFDYNDIDIDIDLSNSFYDNKNDDKKSENNDNK